MEKVIHGLFSLENILFLRVLRTRDRLVRSFQQCIHSLLAMNPAGGVLKPHGCRGRGKQRRAECYPR